MWVFWAPILSLSPTATTFPRGWAGMMTLPSENLTVLCLTSRWVSLKSILNDWKKFNYQRASYRNGRIRVKNRTEQQWVPRAAQKLILLVLKRIFNLTWVARLKTLKRKTFLKRLSWNKPCSQNFALQRKSKLRPPSTITKSWRISIAIFVIKHSLQKHT